MQNEEDVLNEIFVDKNEPVNKRILVEIIRGYATIDNDGVIEYSESYDKLIGHKKVLVHLCCRKAIILKGIEGFKEPASQSEISSAANVSLDVVRNALHRKYRKLLKKDSKGYYIHNYKLGEVKEIILGGEKDD